MSYADYCKGITGQIGNIDLNLPNQSIPYLVSTPYGASGVEGFTGEGGTGGINSTYTSAGYNYMIYSCNTYFPNRPDKWAIICTNGATAPYQTATYPTMTYINPTTFPICGFNTTPILNISLPRPSYYGDNGKAHQPAWIIYGIPAGLYWMNITITGTYGTNWFASNSGVPIISEFVLIPPNAYSTIISGGKAQIIGCGASYNSSNLTYNITTQLFPGLDSTGQPNIYDPFATIKLIKRW